MSRDYLLVSDVDDTLLGDDAAVRTFADWFGDARRYLRLALNSGRFFESVRKSVRMSGLPEPDAYIGGVGTDICLPPSGERLAGWPVTTGGWNVDVIREVCAKFAELELQPREFLSPFKISYYGSDLTEHFLSGLRAQLAERGQAACVLYSSNRNLDVLPAGANKGTSVAQLAQYWQIPRQRVIVAGDSGNDLDMFQQGFLGIIVGNAHPELKSLRDPKVYHARQSHAAGVLEGLEHWLAKPHSGAAPE